MDNNIYVTKTTMPSFEEYAEEIKDLWDTHILTNMGAKHQKLCSELKQYLGVEHVDLLTNGHAALEIALEALQLEGEVITTPFTFASTTHAIVRNGLTPVFCDVKEDDFTIDVDKIEELITEKTCAIMPVHVYGNICDVERISEIARKYGLKVIYDAAHAFGCTYKGRGIASFGDVSCFSFHATKVFNTIEGGAICYHNENLGQKISELKNFGIHDAETVHYAGCNAKMNEFCAAMGLCNLKHIDTAINCRKKVYERYHMNLKGIPGIRVNSVKEEVGYNYPYYPVLFDKAAFGHDRDEVASALANHGIYARKYFYPITNSFACYKNKYDPGMTPIADKLGKSVLTLPLYDSLQMEDVDRICDIIRHL